MRIDFYQDKRIMKHVKKQNSLDAVSVPQFGGVFIMKSKYSYFERFCAVSCLSLSAISPAAVRYDDVKRCADILNER